jgi:hypothetical protein
LGEAISAAFILGFFFETMHFACGVSFFGLLLQFVGIFASFRHPSMSWKGVLFVYNFVLVIWSPQMTIASRMEAFLFIPCLVPIVSGMVICLNRGAWISGIGSGFLLFVATLTLNYNMRRRDSRIGFMEGWIA